MIECAKLTKSFEKIFLIEINELLFYIFTHIEIRWDKEHSKWSFQTIEWDKMIYVYYQVGK